MTIAAAMPLILFAAGAVLIVVGYSWLQDELDNPDRNWWLVFDLIMSGRPFAVVALGMMGAGGYMIYLAYGSLR